MSEAVEETASSVGVRLVASDAVSDTAAEFISVDDVAFPSLAHPANPIVLTAKTEANNIINFDFIFIAPLRIVPIIGYIVLIIVLI